MTNTPNAPITERWHVETVQMGVVVNAEAFNSKEAAERRASQQDKDYAEDNRRLREEYAKSLRRTALDSDTYEEGEDRVPHLFQYDYAHRVAPCPHGDRCVACYEAGFISFV